MAPRVPLVDEMIDSALLGLPDFETGHVWLVGAGQGMQRQHGEQTGNSRAGPDEPDMPAIEFR